MDEITTTALMIVLLGSLPCAVLGYLIAVKQRRHLISGWDEARTSDPQAFANLVGYSMIVMAAALALVAGAWAYHLVTDSEFAVLLGLASLFPVLALIRAKQKYGK